MTPARKVLLLLAGLAIAVAVYRLATGLGTATNLNEVALGPLDRLRRTDRCGPGREGLQA